MDTLVCDLGLTDYLEAWRIQKQLVARKLAGQATEDYLLLVEHPHVFTLGRKGSPQNILDTNIPTYTVERGGDVTYHGPGQQVVYPIVDLSRTQLSVKQYVETLAKIVIDALGRFGIAARFLAEKPGVWVGPKKIASIGIAVDRLVTYHGVALNVNTDLSYFYKIRPCGMPSEVMTSMEKLLGHRVDMGAVKQSIVESYTKNMNTKTLPLQKSVLEAMLAHAATQGAP